MRLFSVFFSIGKGYISRKIAIRERQNELMFVGMQPRSDNYDLYAREVSIAYIKRKQHQSENKDGYEKALEELKDVIIDEEGPEKREQFREDRTLWITDQIAQEKFPTDLDSFYAGKVLKISETGTIGLKTEKSDKKGDKKNDKKNDTKGSKEEKSKSGKKSGSNENEIETYAMPKLQGKTQVTSCHRLLILLFFYLIFYFQVSSTMTLLFYYDLL